MEDVLFSNPRKSRIPWYEAKAFIQIKLEIPILYGSFPLRGKKERGRGYTLAILEGSRRHWWSAPASRSGRAKSQLEVRKYKVCMHNG
jgi:hypothetical protein